MDLICKHDPSDPDHLICEAKESPFARWFYKRYRQFYCVGPNCPPHKAYTHLWIDLLLVGAIGILIASNIWILAKGIRETERAEDLEERISKITVPKEPEPAKPEPPPIYEEPVLSLEAEALYFSAEGEQVGRGPWPPRQGETTKIKVSWQPIVIGDVKDVRISGTLEQNVEWTGFVPLGQRLSYSPGTRIVTWLPQDDTSAVFELAITPSERQIGTGEMVIMGGLIMKGKDVHSGTLIEIVLPDIVLKYKM